MRLSRSSSVLVALCVVLSMTDRSQAQWVNRFDEAVLFECPRGQFVSAVASYHNNGAQDRRFGFACSVLPVKVTRVKCEWSLEYVNKFDQEFDFQCPEGGYVAGIRSVHSNGVEDRRFKFNCCQLPARIVTTACSLSSNVNEWDMPFFFGVPVGKVLTGMTSRHDNGKEDRLFKFATCSLSKA